MAPRISRVNSVRLAGSGICLNATYLIKYASQFCAFSVSFPKHGAGLSDESASMFMCIGEGEDAGVLGVLANLNKTNKLNHTHTCIVHKSLMISE